jgi:hypothetical protein
MSTREFDLGSPRSKEPCIYTQGTYYLPVKAILHGMRKYIIQYLRSDHRSVLFRKNVGDNSPAWKEVMDQYQ